jgi:hypothetical protein
VVENPVDHGTLADERDDAHLGAVHRSPLGRTAISSSAFATSIPITEPCPDASGISPPA